MKNKIIYLFLAILTLIAIFTVSANAAEHTGKEDVSEGEKELLVAEDESVCFVRGDVDFDGEITAADARLILRFAVLLQKPSEKELLYANLNSDVEITAADARKALRIAVELDAGAPHESREELIMEAATCYDIGVTADKCAYCGNLFNFGIIPQKDHTGAGWEIILPSTCTETGLKEMHCVFCDILMQSDDIPLSSHIYGELIYIGERDCTRMQEAYRKCKNCDHSESYFFRPGSHSYTMTVTTTPTCTDYGIEEFACSNCGKVKPDSVQHPLFPLGHNAPVNWTVVNYPTETEDGLKIKGCIRCGEVLESEIMPKTGNNSDLTEVE
ncbi:MAG: dockerin type I repeat-containing protein [Oscillospiraceae bacterium]|nr:dockerin type I repeat-containing protein [Oscillospiraceae bacterium]